MGFLIRQWKRVLNKKSILLIFFLILFIGIFSFPDAVYAQWEQIGEAISVAVGAIFYYIILVPLGALFSVLVDILVWVAGYNNFIHASAVEKGWVIVRDFSNMFFVLILLIIAYATILHIESYQMKRLLPKLLIIAVLINFSKTLVGMIIDLAQVIVISFVNQFEEIGPTNILHAMGADKLISLDQDVSEKKFTGHWVVAAIVLVCIMLFAANVVVLVLIVVLGIRIVMLWLLIVLSPIAFLASTLPQAQKYANQWWQTFGKYVLVGPLLAFFLWLSLSIMGVGENNLEADIKAGGGVEGEMIVNKKDVKELSAISAGVTEALKGENILSFIIAILLLIAGLMLTQQMSIVGGNMVAGAGVGAIKGFSKLMARPGIGVARRIAERGAESATGLGARFTSHIPVVRRLVTKPLAQAHATLKGAREDRKEKKEQQYRSIKDMKVLEALHRSGSKADKDILETIAPSLSGNPEAIKKKLATMDMDKFRKISANEWYRIGQSGVTPQDLIKELSDEQKKYLVSSGKAKHIGIEHYRVTRSDGRHEDVYRDTRQEEPIGYDKNKYFSVLQDPDAQNNYAKIRGNIEESLGRKSLDDLSEDEVKKEVAAYYMKKQAENEAPDMTKEDFLEYYKARRREKPQAKEGVTLGNLKAKVEPAKGAKVSMAVDFEEFNKKLDEYAKGKKIDIEPLKADVGRGVTVSDANKGVYADVMKDYIGEKAEMLRQAQSSERVQDKINALRLFGRAPEKRAGETEDKYVNRVMEEGKIDRMISDTIEQVERAQDRLSNEEFLKSHPFTIVNKGKEDVRTTLRHEKAHTEIDAFTSVGGKIEKMIDAIKAAGMEVFNELENKLKERVGEEAYGKMSEQEKQEEMLADFLAGNYKVNMEKQEMFTPERKEALEKRKKELESEIAKGKEESKSMGFVERGKKNIELDQKREQLAQLDKKIKRQKEFEKYGKETEDKDREIQQKKKTKEENIRLMNAGTLSRQYVDEVNAKIDKDISELEKEKADIQHKQQILIKQDLSEDVQVEMKQETDKLNRAREEQEAIGAADISNEINQTINQQINMRALTGGAPSFSRNVNSNFFDPNSNYFIIKILKKLQAQLKDLARSNLGIRELVNDFGKKTSALEGLEDRIRSGTVTEKDYGIADEVAGKLNALLPSASDEQENE